MTSFLIAIFYIMSFLAVYVQVFFLVTFFENRKKIVIRTKDIELENYPSVTIIVPCYNEENTVGNTINSISALNYPKDKLNIIVVDNASKDGTWDVLQNYIDNPQIKIFQETKIGKHNALNKGLENITTQFVGCLDADSTVHPEALKRIMTYFSNPKTMAVAPSIVVNNPKKLIQYAQRAEYDMAHYNKKMLAFLGGIHVTPGPFSIFRKEVFEQIGIYTKAHHTEDQEIALRMQKNGLKIDHAPDAYVYTNSPNSVPKLYRQRVRWIYGFIRNALDYRELFFKPKYGTIGIFTLPSGFISVVGTIFILFFSFIQFYTYLARKILQTQAVGFHIINGKFFNLDFFTLDSRTFVFVSILLYILVIVGLLNGRRMIHGRKKYTWWDIPVFIIIYTFIAPVWLVKAVWNAVTSKEASWAKERDHLIKNNNI
ncbi:MAG: glycosyltransferase family 2 protein [Candidatus Nomurabacteria bacterium]|nr:glycosyltransferase family 2 protein [Candidatus Nomurabacteria bacterium]